MKKNLKGCVEQVYFEEPVCILDMNDYEMIESNGLSTDLGHKKSAHMTARWDFSVSTNARILLGDPDLSAYRCVTFSVFAINGEGGSFRIRFESDAQNGGDSGYVATLPICRNGWNDYRLELPFLQARLQAQGWDHIRAIELDAAAGGQANRPDTVLCLDNVYAWTEQAPKTYIRMPELKGAAMFSKSSAYAVIDRRRLPIAPDADPSARPFEDSGILWLPMAPIAAVIGHRAVVDNKANTLSFSYRRKQYDFVGGSDAYTVNGEAQRLPFKPVVRGGTLFFPSGYLAEFFHWRQIFTDPAGPVILSNRKNAFDSRRDGPILRCLNAELTFVDPTGEEILEDLHRKIPNPDKGRLLLLPEEWMAQRKLSKTDAVLGELLEKLKNTYGAKTALYAEAPVFASGKPEEDAWDQAASKASARLLSFAALYRMTGEKQYNERCAAECEAIADLTDWNAEASMASAAPLALAVTLAYDWCHSIWSEGRKARIERAVLRYFMRPGVEAYNGRARMWRSGSAASAEINCALTAAALAFANVYPETALKLLRHSLRNVLPCFDAYAPDGGYPEGVAAWERSTRALTLLIAMLRSAVGKDYGLATAPGFSATARFAVFTETDNGSWNFHGDAVRSVNTSVFGWFSREYQNSVYAWIRQRDVRTGKKALDVADLIWYAPISNETPPSLPLDAVYRRAGLAMFRTGWKQGGTFLALHGGSNHEAGIELNAGSFLLEMGGERFFADISGCEALPRLLRARAEGQNTLVVDPTDSHTPDQNPDAVAQITEARSTAAHAYAIVDMTSTNDLITRGKRGILLTNQRSVAVVQDELTVSQPTEAVWSAYTPAQVLSASARTVVLKLNGQMLVCKLSGAGNARFAWEAMENSPFVRITVRASVKDKLRMAVAFRLLREGDSKSEKLYELRPMSAWNLN